MCSQLLVCCSSFVKSRCFVYDTSLLCAGESRVSALGLYELIFRSTSQTEGIPSVLLQHPHEVVGALELHKRNLQEGLRFCFQAEARSEGHRGKQGAGVKQAQVALAPTP